MLVKHFRQLMHKFRTMAIDITLKQLEYLEVVSRHATMRDAATELHLTQSALGAAMDQLERVLGTQLLVRRRSVGVVLTSAGEAVVTSARAVLEAVAGIPEALSEHGPAGTFRIGMSDSLVPIFLANLLEALEASFPLLVPTLTMGSRADLEDAVLNGTIDLAIAAGAKPSLTDQTDLLLEADLLIGLSDTQAEALNLSSATIDLHDLADIPLIISDSALGREFAQVLTPSPERRFRIGFRAQNQDVILAMVRAGRGFGIFLGGPFISTMVAESGVRLCTPDPPPSPARIEALWSPQFLTSRRAHGVRDVVRDLRPA